MEKNIPCTIIWCTKMFASVRLLEEHVRLDHQQRCKYCKSVFYSRAKLFDHTVHDNCNQKK
jgi:hypothetical protein